MLTMAGYSGDAGDAMSFPPDARGVSNGMMFSTPDIDNDLRPARHCAKQFKRGWWDLYSSYSVLNRDKETRWIYGTFTASDVVTSRMLNVDRTQLNSGREA